MAIHQTHQSFHSPTFPSIMVMAIGYMQAQSDKITTKE